MLAHDDVVWSPVPGHLLFAVGCWVHGHRPELMEIDYHAYGTRTFWYRCLRCDKRGVIYARDLLDIAP